MCNQEFYLYFHAYYYQFVLVAGYVSFIELLSRWDLYTRLGQAIFAATLLIGMLLMVQPVVFYSTLTLGRDPEFSTTLRQAFATVIPREAGVYGPHRFSNYLSNRVNFVMGDLREENEDFTAKVNLLYPSTTVRPEQIDYIVIDVHNDQCGWRDGSFDPEKAKRRAANINRLIQSGSWIIHWTQSDVFILKRKK